MICLRLNKTCGRTSATISQLAWSGHKPHCRPSKYEATSSFQRSSRGLGHLLKPTTWTSPRRSSGHDLLNGFLFTSIGNLAGVQVLDIFGQRPLKEFLSKDPLLIITGKGAFDGFRVTKQPLWGQSYFSSPCTRNL